MGPGAEGLGSVGASPVPAAPGLEDPGADVQDNEGGGASPISGTEPASDDAN